MHMPLQSRGWRAGWVLISFIALLLPPTARAADYSVGVQDLDYFPIYAADEKGNYTGYARELLDLFARRNDVRLHYQALPVKRLVNEYLAGRLDFMFPDNPRWDLAGKQGLKVTYSTAAVTFQDAIMVRTGRPSGPMASLGMVRGFTPWKFMPDITAGKLQVQEAPGPRNLINMTLAGHVDGVNMARQVAEYHLKDMGRVGALEADLALLPLVNSQYMLSSIRHPELIQMFDRFMQTDKAAVAALKLKYGL